MFKSIIRHISLVLLSSINKIIIPFVSFLRINSSLIIILLQITIIKIAK